MARLSQHSKMAATKKRADCFKPELKWWTHLCQVCPSNEAIRRSLNISVETLYAFIDREHYAEEQDPKYKSAYLEALYKYRKKNQQIISSKFLENVKNGDAQSAIFGMKVFNNAVEQKDIDAYEIKKIELKLKSNSFLTGLAEKFKLNKDELKDYAVKYFQKIESDVL